MRTVRDLPGALHRAGIGCIVEDGLCRAPHLLHARMLMVALDSDEPGYAAYVAASEPLDVDRADRASAALHDWLGPSHLVSTDETHVEVCRDPQHPTHAAMVQIVHEVLAAGPPTPQPSRFAARPYEPDGLQEELRIAYNRDHRTLAQDDPK